MTKNKLLLIIRMQEIDLFFTEKGFSRDWLHQQVIFPSFFVSKRSYARFLTINAKKQLREIYGLDWEKELKKYKAVNYMFIMEQLEGIDLLEIPDYLLMLQKGAKR
ncbi:MAG: hypothetical protein PHQ74_15005 [Crocinitomicaceae bacterium]|nr:hypothetical protein [Crocinitomicaceae bacterium]